MINHQITKIITDFDETLTVKATITPIVLAASENHTTDRDDFLSAWWSIVDWYTQSTNEIFSRSIATSNAIEDFLFSFEPFEERADKRLMSEKFLADLTIDQLERVGRSTEKKTHVDQALTNFRKNGIEIEVLSANWSRTVIESSIGEHCDAIWTNNLIFDENGRATGEIDLRVTCARHKLEFFERQRSRHGKTIYVGDSLADLLAILSADFGVLIGDSKSVLQAIEHFKIPSKPILSLNEVAEKDQHDTVFFANSWIEIDQVFNLRSSEFYQNDPK